MYELPGTRNLKWKIHEMMKLRGDNSKLTLFKIFINRSSVKVSVEVDCPVNKYT